MEQDRTLGQHPSDNDPKEYTAAPVVLKVLECRSSIVGRMHDVYWVTLPSIKIGGSNPSFYTKVVFSKQNNFTFGCEKQTTTCLVRGYQRGSMARIANP